VKKRKNIRPTIMIANNGDENSGGKTIPNTDKIHKRKITPAISRKGRGKRESIHRIMPKTKTFHKVICWPLIANNGTVGRKKGRVIYPTTQRSISKKSKPMSIFSTIHPPLVSLMKNE
jgi:hypothetical protein